MGFRFRRSFRVLPGVRVNVSKSGTSWSVGRRGFTVNVRKGKITRTVGLPGTGMSWRSDITPHAAPHVSEPPALGAPAAEPQTSRPATGFWLAFAMIAAVAAAIWIYGFGQH